MNMRAFARAAVGSRRTMQSLLAASLALFTVPHPGEASDVYVVRFQTDIVYSSPTECYRVGWRDHLLFRNTTDQDLAVSALAASNGYVPPGPEPLIVPARRSRSVSIRPRLGEYGSTNHWAPRDPTYVFVVNRLDVPAGITVESRGELWGPDARPLLPCPPIGPGAVPAANVFGAIPLPVIRTLVPAATEQVHLSVDLGTQPLRTNVGIYNAGASPASATVELRRSCDDAVIERRMATVAADSVTQITGLSDNPGVSFCNAYETTVYSRYVVVVMDQPGFSFVTTLGRDLPPRVAITTSVAR